MSQKTIVLTAGFLFIIAAGFLFWKNALLLDPNGKNDGWVIAFVDPGNSESLDFFIENRSGKATFSYRIETPDTVIQEASREIDRDTKTVIPVTEKAMRDVRMRITVEKDSLKKQIYR